MKVKIFGKSIPLLAIVALVMSAGLVSAALVNYLSGTLTTTTEVKSPITISGEVTYTPYSGWTPSIPPYISLLTVGDHGIAEWTTEQAHSGSYSIKLGTVCGAVDWAEVSIPVDIALKDISELKFWQYMEDYTTETWWVTNASLALGVDIDDDGVFEADVAGWSFAWQEGEVQSELLAALGDDSFITLETWPELEKGIWKEIKLGPESWAMTPLVDTGRFGGSASYSDILGSIEAGGPYKIPNTDVRVREVILFLGGAVMYETLYVDDITINGETYELDPIPPEPVTETLTEGTVVTFTETFYGADTFYATLDAYNNANNSVTAPIAIVVEAVNNEGATISWEDGLPEITAKLDGVELTSGVEKSVTSDGEYAVILVSGTFSGAEGSIVEGEGSTVSPSGSVTFDLQFNLKQNISPGTYTWRAIAVNPGTTLADIPGLVP